MIFINIYCHNNLFLIIISYFFIFLPLATTTRIGAVQPDGTTIGVNESGVISILQSPIIDISHPIGDPILTLNKTLNANEIWLEGASVSKTTYAKLFAIYGTTYGASTTTNFTLPDFRNKLFSGSNIFGYGDLILSNNGMGIPDYSKLVTIATNLTTYTTPSKGYLYIFGRVDAGHQKITINSKVFEYCYDAGDGQSASGMVFPVPANAVCTLSTTSQQWFFIPSTTSSGTTITGNIRVRVKTRYQ